MKKMIAILMSLLMLCGIACTANVQNEGQNTDAETQTDSKPDPVTGGWQIAGVGSDVLPEDAAKAFTAATEKLVGVNYHPIACLGSQVVAGMNYAILCTAETVTAEPQTSLKVMILYVDLEGETELLEVSDFDLGAYAEKTDADVPAELLMGGWQAPEEAQSPTAMPQNAAAAFSAATDGFVGNSLVPIAYLGSQIVAGTNYAFLCHSTLVTADPVTSIQLVIVYEDLEGNAAIAHIVTIDPSDFH